MDIEKNVFLRADGRWEARYICGENDGRAVYGYVYAKTRAEAELKRAEILSGKLSVTKKLSAEKEKFFPFLTKEQEQAVYSLLVEQRCGKAAALTLCLKAGLTPQEAVAINNGDYNPLKGELTVKLYAEKGSVYEGNARSFPLNPDLAHLFDNSGDCLFSGSAFVGTCAAANKYFNALIAPLVKSGLLPPCVKIQSLRSTFVKNCLSVGISPENVKLVTGASEKFIIKHYGEFIKSDVNEIKRLYSWESGINPKKMNLLILGAGSHGHGVKETALEMRIFDKVSFLDDFVVGDDVIGKCSDYRSLSNEYPCAIPAFGSSELRKEWTEKLSEAGYILPKIIHPSATVSLGASIESGTVIMAHAAVSSGAKIGKTSIIATYGMVGFDACLGDYSHVDCGGIVAKNADLPSCGTVESGAIYKRNEGEII